MRLLVLTLFLTLSLGANAQEKFILFLEGKPNAEYVALSDRSIERRRKNNVELSYDDKEVSPLYLSELSSKGRIINVSRWLNAVLIESELSAEELQGIDFVRTAKSCQKVASKRDKLDFEYEVPKSLNYGYADTQVRQLGVDCLHDQGYTGSSVYLAVIDAGFSGMDTISYFDSTYMNGRVLDVYDFVGNGSVYQYSLHGTAVSSCIFGQMATGPINYAGTAVEVDVALYVTEDMSSETPAEEFNLVTALERCDVQGVDIANISLGYTTFDDPDDDHSYSDLDGNTTIAAQGVNTAFSKGIVVVSAAGNSGPSHISTPCDSDDGLCVGAVDNLGYFAPFSSVGPNADFQIKPDVVATGWRTWVVLDDGSLVQGNGTSFASPTMAGAVACLIDANPTASAGIIIDAVQNSGHQFSNPDEQLGYGIPDMCAASDEVSNTIVGIEDKSGSNLSIYPNPSTGDFTIKNLDPFTTIRIIDNTGKQVFIKELEPATTTNLSLDLSQGLYTLSFEEIGVKRRLVIQ